MKLLLLILTIIFMFVAPATASAAPTASIRAGQGDTFTATANGTNLTKIDIYRTPTGYASWTYMGTGSCSGSTCSYSISWDPSSTGTRDWYIVVNAFDATGQCTGNPFPFGPSWSDCGANDYTGMTPPPPTSPNGSCRASGTTADLSWSASGGTSYAVYAQNAANPFVWGAAACQSPNLCWNPPYTSPSASTSFSTTPGVSYNWYVFNCNSWGCNTPVGGNLTCAYPNCNTNLDCVLCGAPANTCSTNNGTQTCYYRAYTGGGTCNVVSFNQSCTINKCDSPLGYTCSNGTCVPPPPTASITGSSSGTTGQSLSFTATANGTNLNRIGIYRSPKDIQSWTEIASGSCSGSTCSLTGSWTPTAGDAKDWYVVANAYDIYSQQCTGNPWTSFPNPTFSNCGSNDSMTTTVSLPPPTNPSASCPIPGTTANFIWTGVSGAGGYTVYAFNTAGTQWNSANPWDNMRCGSGGLDVCDRVTGTSDSPTSLTPGANYQWYVFACVGDTNNCSDPASYSTTFTCIPAPISPTPTVTPNLSCTPVDTGISSNMYTISWTNNPSTPVTYVDISTDNFVTFYNKAVSGASTSASSGFALWQGVGQPNGPSLTLQPNTTYYVRTYNEYNNSGTTTFTTPGTCPPPTASITGPLTALVDQPLTYSAQIFNASSGTVFVTRSDNNTFTCPPGIFTDSTQPTGRNWCIIETFTNGNFNGSTFSAAFTPRESGIYRVVVNAYANTTASYTTDQATECTGSPYVSFPSPVWSDCGRTGLIDNITTNVDRTPAPPPTTNCGGGVSPRAEGLVTTPTLQTGSKFGTSTTGRCVVNDSTIEFKPFKIPTYDDLKSIYYTQSKATKIQSSSQNLNPTTSADDRKVFNYTAADVSVNSAAPYAGTAVIFIDGNLNIDKDITTSDRTKGLVLVVKNNVNIDVGVKQIDAVIMSAGKIYTAGAGCATNNVETANALIVNGSLISLDPGAIVFCRTLINNSQAAERIYQQPKYLVILRDLFADTLQKWSEIP